MTTKLCTFAAAVFALLTVAAPAHAAYVSDLVANVDLNFGSSEELIGSIDLTRVTNPPKCCFSGPYFLSASNLSFNGSPLTPVGIPLNAGKFGTVGWFTSPTNPSWLFDLVVNTAYLSPNPTYVDFALGTVSGFSVAGTATGGTVTVLSETLATPLPAALPLFGSAVLGLAGVAWYRGKVSA
jgi:hypothetical protein